MDNTRERVYSTWNDYWARYTGITRIGTFLQHQADEAFLRVARDLNLPGGIKVLDFGCGAGRTISLFKGLGYSDITGIDNSEKCIRHCEKKGLHLDRDIFLIDGTQTSFKDGEFDLVFSEGVLEHFEDIEPFVKEMCRVSRGHILLVQPNHFSFSGRIVRILSDTFRDNVPELSYPMRRFVDSYKKYGFNLKLMKSTLLHDTSVLLFAKIPQ